MKKKTFVLIYASVLTILSMLVLFVPVIMHKDGMVVTNEAIFFSTFFGTVGLFAAGLAFKLTRT